LNVQGFNPVELLRIERSANIPIDRMEGECPRAAQQRGCQRCGQ
jgi:hypothetical protein